MKRILSMDGGGIRGVFTLQVLAYGVDGHEAALTLAKALIAGS